MPRKIIAYPVQPSRHLEDRQIALRTVFLRSLDQLQKLLAQKEADDANFIIPSCFLCYAWGIQRYEDFVHQLGQDLKALGLDVIVDVEANRSGNIGQFIELINESKLVIVTGTRLLLDKFHSGKIGPDDFKGIVRNQTQREQLIRYLKQLGILDTTRHICSDLNLEDQPSDYWDKIPFPSHIQAQKEAVIRRVKQLVAQYTERQLPVVQQELSAIGARLRNPHFHNKTLFAMKDGTDQTALPHALAGNYPKVYFCCGKLEKSQIQALVPDPIQLNTIWEVLKTHGYIDTKGEPDTAWTTLKLQALLEDLDQPSLDIPELGGLPGKAQIEAYLAYTVNAAYFDHCFELIGKMGLVDASVLAKIQAEFTAQTQPDTIAKRRRVGEAGPRPEPGLTSATEPIFYCPSLAGHFVRRQTDIDAISDKFVANAQKLSVPCERFADLELKKGQSSVTVTISGMPGIGKTELAKDFAKFFRATFPNRAVMFLDAKNLADSFTVLAEQLEIPLQNLSSEKSRRDRVLTVLAREYPNSLLIFDGASDYASIAPYIPPTMFVLVTTQNQSMEYDLPVEGLAQDDAETLLANCTGISEVDGLTEVVQMLGRHPLALAYAGVFIKLNPDIANYRAYIAAFESNPHQVMEEQRHVSLRTDYPRYVMDAIRMGIQQLREKSKPSFNILVLLAKLSTSPVTWTFVQNAFKTYTSQTTQFDIVADLKEHSIVSFDEPKVTEEIDREPTQATLITIHQLTQLACQELFQTLQMDWNQVLTALLQTFTEMKYRSYYGPTIVSETLLVHLLAVLEKAKETELGHSELYVNALRLAGTTQRLLYRLDQSTESLRQAEQLVDTHFNGTALQATIYFELAYTFWRNGKTADMVSYHKKALAIRKALPDGKTSIETAMSYDRLGWGYIEIGKFDKAIQCYNAALNIRTRLPDQPDLGRCFHGLGSAYEKKGEWSAGLSFLVQAIEWKKRRKGPDDISVAHSYSNMGKIKADLGRYDEAIADHEEALRIRKLKKGPDNPEVAYSYHFLGICMRGLRRFSEANTYFQDALKIRTDTLGRRHLFTAYTLREMALLREREQNLSDAATHIDEAVGIIEETNPNWPKLPDYRVDRDRIRTALEASASDTALDS